MVQSGVFQRAARGDRRVGCRLSLEFRLFLAPGHADASLVRLRQGDNTLQFTLGDGDGAVLFARLSDSKGLPVPGIVAR